VPKGCDLNYWPKPGNSHRSRWYCAAHWVHPQYPRNVSMEKVLLDHPSDPKSMKVETVHWSYTVSIYDCILHQSFGQRPLSTKNTTKLQQTRVRVICLYS